MTDSNLYLIVCAGGSYSDQWSTNLCLVGNEVKASELVQECNDLLDQLSVDDLAFHEAHPELRDYRNSDADQRAELYAERTNMKEICAKKITSLLGIDTKLWISSAEDCGFSYEVIAWTSL